MLRLGSHPAQAHHDSPCHEATLRSAEVREAALLRRVLAVSRQFAHSIANCQGKQKQQMRKESSSLLAPSLSFREGHAVSEKAQGCGIVKTLALLGSVG